MAFRTHLFVRDACAVLAVMASTGAGATSLQNGAVAGVGLGFSPQQFSVFDGDSYGGQAQASIGAGSYGATDYSGTPFTAQSTAAADMRSGKLRTSGSISQASQSSDAFVYSQAVIANALTFSLPTGMASALVTFTLYVEGSTYGVVQSYCGVSLVSSGIAGWYNNCALTGSQTFEYQAWVLPGVEYQFWAGIQQNAFNRSPAGYDFLNTATIGYSLPDGVSFQSSTGYFLTGPSTPVPEPGTLALLGLGLAGLGLSRHRKAV